MPLTHSLYNLGLSNCKCLAIFVAFILAFHPMNLCSSCFLWLYQQEEDARNTLPKVC